MSFDLSAYEGMWYEIGRYPFEYEDHCGASAARYVNDPENGGIHVVNICYSDPYFQNISTYDQGFAWRINDASGMGDFRIKFLRPGSFESDYIVLDTDYKNYAIVGEVEKDLLWIMVREKKVSRAMLNMLLEKIEELGFQRRFVILNDTMIA